MGAGPGGPCSPRGPGLPLGPGRPGSPETPWFPGIPGIPLCPVRPCKSGTVMKHFFVWSNNSDKKLNWRWIKQGEMGHFPPYGRHPIYPIAFSTLFPSVSHCNTQYVSSVESQKGVNAVQTVMFLLRSHQQGCYCCTKSMPLQPQYIESLNADVLL